VRTKRFLVRRPAPWLNGEARSARCSLRHAERTWRKTGLAVHEQIFEDEINKRNFILEKAKTSYYNAELNECRSNPRALYKIINSLSGSDVVKPLPPHDDPATLADEFATFFHDKVARSRDDTAAADAPEACPADAWDSLFLTDRTDDDLLSAFEPVPSEVIKNIIVSSPSTSCALDPIPTWLLKKVLAVLLEPLTRIVNLSLSSGRFPSAWKNAIISPLLKKPSLDPKILLNYRPIAFLPFSGKLIERSVASQLNDHLATNSVLSDYQSAYRIGHSIETLLISLLNDLL